MAAAALTAPLGLLAELTHRCPLGCPYCSNPLALEKREDELDTATWARVFSEAASLGVLQVHLSGGAGVVWSGLAGIHGLEQRQNYFTQLGAGVARVRANGSAVSLETRFYHLSNDGAKPPNLGMEQISVLVGYRLPR